MTKLIKIFAFAVPACAMLALAQPATAADEARTTTAAAGAASAASAVAAKSAQTTASRANKVCINVIPDTGSRMTRRMCMTKAEWADEGVNLDAKK